MRKLYNVLYDSAWTLTNENHHASGNQLKNKFCPKSLDLSLFAFPAVWNAEPIPPGSAKRNRKKSSLRSLRARAIPLPRDSGRDKSI